MKHFSIRRVNMYLAGFATFLFVMALANFNCNTGGGVTPAAGPLNFPQSPKPVIPNDVDTALKSKLESEQKFADVQRLFDLVSWQTFMALNWPTGPDGKPRPNLSDAGVPAWAWYKESFEVYKPDGSPPAPWGSGRTLNEAILNHAALPAEAVDKNHRVLYRNNKHREMSFKADEADQAFSGGLWDQNGNLVLYEVLMNETEFNYVVTNKLYNLDGQIAFSKAGNKVVFPAGKFGTDQLAAVEVKIAWKVIDPDKDIAGRFLTVDGYIPDPSQAQVDTSDCSVDFPANVPYVKVKLGMVGMHIALKTTSSPQWIWGTFEQIDNISADPMITGKTLSGKTVNLQASFYDPSCTECLPNVCVAPGKDGKRRTQLIRMIPIPGDKRQLNLEAAQTLGRLNSVLQYYQLIDTQWPTDPSAKPTPPGNGVASVNNKAGGNVTPVFLTNMTMETYFQQGVQEAWGQEEGYGKPPKPTPADKVQIWATESCTGCHYSAGVAIGDTTIAGKRIAKFGPPQSADFSWLLKTQAKFVNLK